MRRIANECVAHALMRNGDVPNNALCPVLLYSAAVPVEGRDPAAAFESLFESNRWTGGWRNGIFAYHHFHSTAHEVLGVYSGRAAVELGGPGGLRVEIEAGDVVVVPAGVGHKQIDAHDLGVVGAYPDGQRADLCLPDEALLRQRTQTVAAVPLPALDPVHGACGPLTSRWKPVLPAA